MQSEKATRELLMQISKGDEDAFKSLFHLYQPRLYAYIFRMIKSREVAEEIVMDVFMKIWLGRALISKIENFDAFLFRIACNKSIDFLRVAAKDKVIHGMMWENLQIAENATAENELIRQEYESTLREAMALLSPQRRQVFHLSRIEGLSHEQIASRLHLSKHTINNHITEAKRFIRTYLIENLDLAILVLLFFS